MTLPFLSMPCPQPPPDSPATIASIGRLLLPSRYSTLSASGCVTRLNRFTCVTAWTSLCLRLTHVVTFMSPRLDSRWGGSSPFRGGNLTRTKVGAQVHVDDTSLFLDNRLCHSVHRLMSCSFRSVSVRSRLEVGFEDRLQDELERPPDPAVTNRRNRKDSNLVTSVLHDFFLPCLHGPIRVCDQFTLDLFQKPLYSAFFNSLKRDPIDSGSPVVSLGRLVGFVQRFRFADVNIQSPKAPGWFSLRLDV